MAAETTGDEGGETFSGLSPEGERQSDEAFKGLAPDLKARIIETTTDPALKARYQKLASGGEQPQKPAPPAEASALARTGEGGESALTITGAPPPGLAPKEVAPKEVAPKAGARLEEKAPPEPAAPSGQIFGRTTIFHYNHDGSRDKEDPGSTGFFGVNLDDPNLVGAAVPVDILEAQFGKFTQRLPDGTYAALNTPEAREIIARIKSSHVLVNAPDGRQIEVPIVDIQGSYKNWRRTLDLTLGAWNALGLKDDTYLGYSVVAGDGTVMNAQSIWSDSSPLAKFYKEGGKEVAGRPDSEILAAARSVVPDMPQEDYERAMRDPAHGEDDLKKYKARTKTPGEELASTEGSPYFGLGKDDLVKKVYSDLIREAKIDPAKVDLVDLRQRLFPNAGPIEAVSQFFDGTSEARAAFNREFSKEVHAASGNAYGWPQALLDFAKFFRFGTDEPPARSKADEWIGKNARLDDLGKQFMGYLNGLAQAQNKQAQIDAERAARAEKTVAGKVGGVVGGGTAGLATQLPELALGGEAKAAAWAYGLYHGISTYGREVAQKGQAQAFWDGIGEGGLASIWRYGMNSPAGFWTLFGTGWLADTGEDSIRKFINGEKIDPVDFGIHSVFDLTSAGIFSFLTPRETFKRTGVATELVATEAAARERSALLEPKRALAESERARLEQEFKTQQEQAETQSALLRGQVLGFPVSEEMVWHAPGPIVARPVEREAFTPGELSLAAGELPSGVATSELSRQAGMLKPPAARGLREVHLADPLAGLKEERNSVIRAETRSMLEAKERGEIDKAAEHANRAIAHLEPEERTDLAKHITKYTERFSDNGATPGEAPKEPMSEAEKIMLRHHTGLGSLEALEERPIDDGAEIERHLHVEGLEKDQPLEEPPEFYSGFSPAPIVRGIRKLATAAYESEIGRALREKFDPGSFGEVGRTTEQVVRQAHAEAETTIAAMNAQLAHEHRMNELLKGGEKVAVRQRFFAKFSRSIQKGMIIAWEKGQHVGNNYAQEIFKFHAAFYKAIEDLEKRFGFTYKARDYYIYHLIKGGKQAQARFERWFNDKVAADPRWTHKRTYSQLEDLLKAGFELQTYNPEELLQHRFFSSQMAINKVKELRQLEKDGYAWNVKREGLTQSVKDLGGAQGELIRRAPNGERYYVREEAQPVLTNAWDMGNIYSHRIFGPGFKALAIAKANSVPVKLLGFSHMRHLGVSMNASAFQNALTQAGIRGKVTPALFKREFARMTRESVGNSPEVKFLRTGRGYEALGDAQKRRIEYWHRGGANIRATEAEQTTFSSWAHQQASDIMERLGVPRGTRPKVHGAGTVFEAGYDAAMSVNDWQFHSLIPQLKWNHFQLLVDNLLRSKPELLKTENKLKFDRELTKIGKETDNRFGEAFYKNLLWPRTWKQLGANLLLSLTWNLGGGRMYAGAFHDTSLFAEKLLTDPRRLSRDDLTERMTFVFNYHIVNILTNALVNYASVSAWNYMHPDKKQDPMPRGSLFPSPDSDFTMPRTGALDEQGRPKRLAPVEYPREIAIWRQHAREEGPIGGTLTMVQHKQNPIVSTLLEEMQNRNFYGKEIYDPNDVVNVGGMAFPNFKQIQDRASHILEGFFGPIATSAAPETHVGPLKFGRPQGSWFDAAWSLFGYPPASRRARATEEENLIYNTKARLTGTKHTDIDDQKYAAYNALRTAIKAGDPHAQRAASDELWRLGVSEKNLKGFVTHLHKHPDETAAEHVWKSIPADEHRELLLRFRPEVRSNYYKMLTAEGQESVLKLMALKGDKELGFFRSITDKKVLDKLDREARAHGGSTLQRRPAVGMQEGGLVPPPNPALAQTPTQVPGAPPARVQPFSPGATGVQEQAKGFQQGGQAQVPGSGGGDKVPALLEPGEFVMQKSAVKRIGVDKLRAMNNPPLYERPDSGKA